MFPWTINPTYPTLNAQVQLDKILIFLCPLNREGGVWLRPDVCFRQPSLGTNQPHLCTKSCTLLALNQAEHNVAPFHPSLTGTEVFPGASSLGHFSGQNFCKAPAELFLRASF